MRFREDLFRRCSQAGSFPKRLFEVGNCLCLPSSSGHLAFGTIVSDQLVDSLVAHAAYDTEKVLLGRF